MQFVASTPEKPLRDAYISTLGRKKDLSNRPETEKCE